MENQQKNSGSNNNSDNRNSNNNNNKKKPSKTVVIWIVSILLTFMIWQGITAIQQSKQEKITYDTFLQMLDDKLVTDVKLYNDRISFMPISHRYPSSMRSSCTIRSRDGRFSSFNTTKLRLFSHRNKS